MTRYRYDELELHVDPEPVRLACVSCGRRLTDTVVRCDDCIGRGGVATGFVTIALLVAVFVAVAFALHVAASRSGSDPRPATGLIGPGLSGAPGYDSPGGSARPAPGASTGEDTPTTIGMRPASDGAAAAASPPAATPVYRGTATWYCGNGSPCTRGYGPSDLVAAIDRKDAEFRQGDRVIVCYRDRAVVVTIVDTCACPDRRVIDLSTGAFIRLAPLGLGVIPVTLESADGIRLPETHQEGQP